MNNPDNIRNDDKRLYNKIHFHQTKVDWKWIFN